MHEMGIASSILDAVRKEQMRYPGYRAAKVGVRIGDFAGVQPDSLRFCFEALVQGAGFDALQLAIEPRPGDELDLGWIEFDDAEVAA